MCCPVHSAKSTWALWSSISVKAYFFHDFQASLYRNVTIACSIQICTCINLEPKNISLKDLLYKQYIVFISSYILIMYEPKNTKEH